MNYTTDPAPTSRGPLGSTPLLLVAVAVIVIVAVAAAVLTGLIGSPAAADATPTPLPTAVASPTPADSPSPSVEPTPPGGELPSGPAAGVMSFAPACDVVPPVNVPATTVLEDGRVVWRTDDGGLVVRQLTTESLADFSEQVRSTGLFDTSASYDLERRPGTPDPPGRGLCVWNFTWNDGGEEIDVASVMWLGDDEEALYYQPAPQRETLHALAEQLMDPTGWYAEDGWIQPEAVPYEPQTYLVLASVTVPQIATQGAPEFDEISWPFDAPPDEFGVEFGLGDPPTRCDVVDAEAAEALAEELAAAGLEQFEMRPLSGAGAALPWAARGAAVDFTFWVSLPDGRPGCSSRGP